VRELRPDGKIDLSLDQAGYRRVAPLALRIVQALQRSGGRERVNLGIIPAIKFNARAWRFHWPTVLKALQGLN
jgi:hypothetical protein